MGVSIIEGDKIKRIATALETLTEIERSTVEKADKADTVLKTTLSRGRKADTNVEDGSFAFGNNVEASGIYSHAIGVSTTASGNSSHAEGTNTTSSNSYSHAEGFTTIASGLSSHAEGNNTIASGESSHAEGFNTSAQGAYSHAQGYNTIATGKYQHAFGAYNEPDELITEFDGNKRYDPGQIVYTHHKGSAIYYTKTFECLATNTGDVASSGNLPAAHWKQLTSESSTYKYPDLLHDSAYIEVVGNGTQNAVRSNARTLDWFGNEKLLGKLTVGSGPSDNMDVATKQYVDETISSTDFTTKQYVDSKIASADFAMKQYVNNSISSADIAMKQYVDETLASENVAMKQYVDEAISSMESIDNSEIDSLFV